jgi:DNA-binding NtrC family response regulator
VPAGEPSPPRPRLIALSGAPLAEAVDAGRFRADLSAALSAVCIVLPPLRARRPAVRPLSERFLREFAARDRAGVRGIAADALDALERYDWPGNVRELRNVIERAVAVCPGAVLRVRDLPEAIALAGVDAPFLTSGRRDC